MTTRTFEITKSFRFEACHSLPHLRNLQHPCRRQHGHSYEVIVGVAGPIADGEEWVQDYSDISSLVMLTISQLDHQDLNKVLDRPTTAENLAAWIWERLEKRLPLLSRIEVRETPTSNVILKRGERSENPSPYTLPPGVNDERDFIP